MRSPFFFGVVIAIVALALVPAPSRAQEDGAAPFIFVPAPTEPTATTERGYFVYAMEAGAEVSGTVLLQNPGPTPITIDLVAVDAQTAQTGGAAFAANDAPAQAMGRWITLEEQRITLGSQRQQTVAFTMRVPPTTPAAQYLAGIAAYIVAEPSAQGEQAASGINVQTRYVLAVQADVGSGWASSFAVQNVRIDEQPSGVYLAMELHNNGAMFVKPTGTLTVRDQSGATTLEQPISLGLFIPGTTTTYPVVWPGTPEPGNYTVSVRFQYEQEKVVEYEQSVAITSNNVAAAQAAAEASTPAPVPAAAPAIPVWMFATVGVLLVIIIVLLALNLRRGRPAPPTAA